MYLNVDLLSWSPGPGFRSKATVSRVWSDRAEIGVVVSIRRTLDSDSSESGESARMIHRARRSGIPKIRQTSARDEYHKIFLRHNYQLAKFVCLGWGHLMSLIIKIFLD